VAGRRATALTVTRGGLARRRRSASTRRGAPNRQGGASPARPAPITARARSGNAPLSQR